MGMLNAEITKLPFPLTYSLFQYHCLDFAFECVTPLKELTVCFSWLFLFVCLAGWVRMIIWFLFLLPLFGFFFCGFGGLGVGLFFY